MPDLDGMALMAHLRADVRTATVPVILLTARVRPSQIREGMRAGADDYLTKPFQRDELIASVKAQLDKGPALAREPDPHGPRPPPLAAHRPRHAAAQPAAAEHRSSSELALGGNRPCWCSASTAWTGWSSRYGPSCRKAVLLCQSERLRALMRERKLHSSHDLLAMLNDRELAIMLASRARCSTLREWIGRLNSGSSGPSSMRGGEHFVTPVMGWPLRRIQHACRDLAGARQSALDGAQRDGSTYTCYDREQAGNHKIQLELHPRPVSGGRTSGDPCLLPAPDACRRPLAGLRSPGPVAAPQARLGVAGHLHPTGGGNRQIIELGREVSCSRPARSSAPGGGKAMPAGWP